MMKKSIVSKHGKCLKEIIKEHHKVSGKLQTITGDLIFRYLLNVNVWIHLLQKTKIWQTDNMQPFHNTRLKNPHNQLVNNQSEPKGTKLTQNGTRL